MEHYNTFTWYETKKKKEKGVIRKSLYLFGNLLLAALMLYTFITAFNIITTY